ncbi:MAG: CYTH domain-containing protein [Breznakia sp.]
MKAHIEKEYKLLLTKQQFEKLYALHHMPVYKTQINTYFDTLENTLLQQKSAMRIRQTDNNFLFTLKRWKGNDLLEYECPVSSNSIDVLQQAKIQTILKRFGIFGPFKILTSLTTQRATIKTDVYELCFDINFYNHKTDYEIEYEYKKEHDGLSTFNAILSPINVRYTSNAMSKIMRALTSKKTALNAQ